ncbi:NADH-quinone oxidoreductase subunit J [Sodalis-like secondary symbiont of Drepanosiphum platanoidis]|uniref:NADH-quinone oxidoreductase subunit J n=1 Tax=Sodalis-like secondary symbiont of Drepanosiphum platanoidis TaxID=2994493 RepID=UPI003463C785
MSIIFYIFGIISIISTCIVIFHKHPVYSLFYLILSLISVSCMFFSIGSYIAGSLEIIIYAGAIMILFIFIVMLLDSGKKINKNKYFIFLKNKYLFYFFILIIFNIFFYFLINESLKNKIIYFNNIEAKNIGISLFGPYSILVELSSMLLLSSLISALYMGRNFKHYLNSLKN